MISGRDAQWRGGRWWPYDGLDLAGGAGLLGSRDAVDAAVAAAGKGAKRSDGKLPPYVVAYLVMALALFAGEDYEEVAARLTETLVSWGCWDDSWSTPTSGGITQARQRLGPEPLALLFDKVAVPVAGLPTRGAFLRHWRLMAIDGFELDVPDTPANAAAFGYPAGARERPAFPKVRVVTIGECGSHAKIAAQMGPVGGRGASEQALARRMFGRLEQDWLLSADRGFYNWPDWPGLTARGGKKRPAMISSRPACAGPVRCCGPRVRTWSARRSMATWSISARSP